jgi:SAM-dependent methyltransferase
MAIATTERPGYDLYRPMLDERARLAQNFARQILETARPFLPKPAGELDVLDVGCGYGHTANELAKMCRTVVGIEPSAPLATAAQAACGLAVIRHQSIYDLTDENAYDLVILDNVFEHLPDQPRGLAIISAALRSGGVAFLLMPNKLWPIEVHYHLPFLSYLPLWLANAYLRLTRRGTDYTDASYAPTYWRLNRLLRARPELRFQYVLPADVSLTTAGNTWLYRAGVAAIGRCPWLWAISKALLVVAVKHG